MCDHKNSFLVKNMIIKIENAEESVYWLQETKNSSSELEAYHS